MENVELGTVYDWAKMDKQAMPPSSEKAIAKQMVNIGSWFSSNLKAKYYMLLSNERRDYTVLNFLGHNYDLALQELQELFDYRGTVHSIDYNHEHNYYEIWIKDASDAMVVYLLFPCDDFIVEID